MKSIEMLRLAAALLIVGCAAPVMADGGGLPPIKPSTPTNPRKPSFILTADGGGLPPIKPNTPTSPRRPPFMLMADGGGLPPIKKPSSGGPVKPITQFPITQFNLD
jgi:hypothetical protein